MTSRLIFALSVCYLSRTSSVLVLYLSCSCPVLVFFLPSTCLVCKGRLCLPVISSINVQETIAKVPLLP